MCTSEVPDTMQRGYLKTENEAKFRSRWKKDH